MQVYKQYWIPIAKKKKLSKSKNKEKLLLDKKNFPKEFEMKLDITKVTLQIFKS